MTGLKRLSLALFCAWLGSCAQRPGNVLAYLGSSDRCSEEFLLDYNVLKTLVEMGSHSPKDLDDFQAKYRDVVCVAAEVQGRELSIAVNKVLEEWRALPQKSLASPLSQPKSLRPESVPERRPAEPRSHELAKLKPGTFRWVSARFRLEASEGQRQNRLEYTLGPRERVKILSNQQDIAAKVSGSILNIQEITFDGSRASFKGIELSSPNAFNKGVRFISDEVRLLAGQTLREVFEETGSFKSQFEITVESEDRFTAYHSMQMDLGGGQVSVWSIVVLERVKSD